LCKLNQSVLSKRISQNQKATELTKTKTPYFKTKTDNIKKECIHKAIPNNKLKTPIEDNIGQGLEVTTCHGLILNLKILSINII
jgi:long-subunit fatty acid transport protein